MRFVATLRQLSFFIIEHRSRYSLHSASMKVASPGKRPRPSCHVMLAKSVTLDGAPGFVVSSSTDDGEKRPRLLLCPGPVP